MEDAVRGDRENENERNFAAYSPRPAIDDWLPPDASGQQGNSAQIDRAGEGAIPAGVTGPRVRTR
jgi:hypothetical protein